jgi:hypothetical protein
MVPLVATCASGDDLIRPAALRQSDLLHTISHLTLVGAMMREYTAKGAG